MSSVAVAQSRAAQSRAVLARAALASAEERTGATRWVRPPPTTPPGPQVAPEGSGQGRPTPRQAAQVRTVAPSGARVLPVPASLAGLLPSGGLDQGTTVVVRGSTSLTLSLVAEASRTGTWVALVGLSRVGVLAAHQLGLDLEKVVLVPAPGPDGPVVVAALLDGVGLVVVGDVALSDADRRRLSARARERGAVLLSTASWPGAHVVLTAEAEQWEGLGQGHGRLRSRRLRVRGGGRGAAGRGWLAEVVVPARAGGEALAGSSEIDPVPLWDGRRAG